MPDTCNVCSSRMSPMPHPHTSGNMWLSRCDYVRKLIEPKKFTQAMYRTNPDITITDWYPCFGLGRFASEHCKPLKSWIHFQYIWTFDKFLPIVSSYTGIHSHPDVLPCDVDDSSQYTWNYADIPGQDFSLGLAKAPRWKPEVYLNEAFCPQHMAGNSLQERLAEYAVLYNKAPPSLWYGWDWYQEGS